GQIFSAVPTNIVEKWFDIIEQKYMDELKFVLAQVRKDERKKIAEFLGNLLDDDNPYEEFKKKYLSELKE
ncbi:MAG: hypothetical protein AABY15_07655, partial [Nanoarchaeota archaeon]